MQVGMLCLGAPQQVITGLAAATAVTASRDGGDGVDNSIGMAFHESGMPNCCLSE